VVTGVRTEATIERDRWGIPHIFADNQHDLWFAFGFAMAQDRLFQMDYLRRKGSDGWLRCLVPTRCRWTSWLGPWV